MTSQGEPGKVTPSPGDDGEAQVRPSLARNDAAGAAAARRRGGDDVAARCGDAASDARPTSAAAAQAKPPSPLANGNASASTLPSSRSGGHVEGAGVKKEANADSTAEKKKRAYRRLAFFLVGLSYALRS